MSGAKSSGRKNLGIFSSLMLSLNILCAVSLAVSLVSVHFSPERSWILPFFGLFYPYLVALNLFFILYWVLRRKWFFFISLAVILSGWNHLGRAYQFRKSSIMPQGQQSFKLLSYNVKNLSNDNVNLLDPEIRNNILHYLQDMKPDVICLQEFAVIHQEPESFIDSISQILGLPYHAYVMYSGKSRKRFDAIFTFSRFPIIFSEGLKMDDEYHYSLYSDILWGIDTFRLFNVHLESVRFKHEDYRFISDFDLQIQENENIKEGSRKILMKLRTAFGKRAAQTDHLSSSIRYSPHPVILCGDFNDTPNSYTYQKLTNQLRDAFIDSGQGFGNTYIGKLPSFRIDYILYGDFFSAWEFRRELVRFSDHYPISCIIGDKPGELAIDIN